MNEKKEEKDRYNFYKVYDFIQLFPNRLSTTFHFQIHLILTSHSTTTFLILFFFLFFREAVMREAG